MKKLDYFIIKDDYYKTVFKCTETELLTELVAVYCIDTSNGIHHCLRFWHSELDSRIEKVKLSRLEKLIYKHK